MPHILPDRLAIVLLASFPAGPWQANCYIAALAPEHPCVIIDPGVDAGEGIAQALSQYRLEPQAVLLTHGHLDHMAGAAQFADAHDLPVFVHEDDEHLLSDPAANLSSMAIAYILERWGSLKFAPPKRVQRLEVATPLELAGLGFDFLHAPGHTPGCTLLRVAETRHGPMVFSGDVVFAGSIGRTDLPGGDPEVMNRSLEEVVLGLDDATHLLPGHGAITSMGAERLNNPYLRALQGTAPIDDLEGRP